MVEYSSSYVQSPGFHPQYPMNGVLCCLTVIPGLGGGEMGSSSRSSANIASLEQTGFMKEERRTRAGKKIKEENNQNILYKCMKL